MATEFRTVLSGAQSVLGATLVVSGSMGLGVRSHRYAGYAHAISAADWERLTEAIKDQAGSEPYTRAENVQRDQAAAAAQLVDTSRALSSGGDGQPGPAQLLESFTGWAKSMKSVAALALLTSLAPYTGRGSEGSPEPATRREIQSFYRLAVEIFNDGGAAELLRTTSALIGLRRIGEEYPRIYEQITQHAEDYGWLRSRGSGADPMTAKDVVDRLQVIALRWARENIEHLAGSPADLATFDVLLKAETVARSFFGMIAAALGCSVQQVLFSSPNEIEAALSEASPLPIEEIDRRVRDGFTVERSEGNLDVSFNSHPSPDRTAAGALLGGMTGCRGRAVGPVRVIRGEAELKHLQLGDVLVTAASTTDMMGGSTVFPTRGGGPPAVAKAIAVVADEGGLLSHAAIVCRERGIPCVLGTEFATAKLHDGQIVEVDATRANGVVLAY